MANKVDVWLRGPVEGIDPLLQPAAHALIQVREDVESMCASIDTPTLWSKPSEAASIGFHLRHMAGAIQRLFTYARGEQLSEIQVAESKTEAVPGDPAPGAQQLLDHLRSTIDNALDQMKITPAGTLPDHREVGIRKLPSSVIGLMFHASEHAQRHSGQIATTLKILERNG